VFSFPFVLKEWESTCKWWRTNQCALCLRYRRYIGWKAWTYSSCHPGRETASPQALWGWFHKGKAIRIRFQLTPFASKLQLRKLICLLDCGHCQCFGETKSANITFPVTYCIELTV